MITFPNCKINLGLHVLQKRTDGYHDIETIFYPVPITDALEIIKRKETDQQPSLTVTGLQLPGNPSDNICMKAYGLLKKDFPGLPPVEIFLHKAIPAGAGLGGGSADGAFTLKMLNQLAGLNLSQQQLISYAAMLGSDCPFFIINKPCYATGRGELLEEMQLDLSAYTIVLINPGIHVETAKAFSGITPALPAHSLKEMIQQPVANWKNVVLNDFEKPVFNLYPAIREIKETLYRQGAVYAAMSGSGSTVYGIFNKKGSPVFSFPEAYFVRAFAGK